MQLTKWDPFRELEEVSDRLNRVFGRSLIPIGDGGSLISKADWSPSVDVAETDAEYQIKAELPGVKKEDVKVSLDNGMLSIKGERRQEKEEKNKTWHRTECSYGSFLRTFSLPENTDDSKVDAVFTDGVLNVRIPKTTKSAPKAREIKVS